MTSSSQNSARSLRKRERRAAERLLGNSALRDELNDEQANQLLEWGFDQIGNAVGRTKYLPDEDAAAAVEPTVTAVSQVMLAVNRLMANFAVTDGVAEAENALTQFVTNLRKVQTPPADVYDRLALLITMDNTEEIFASLMALLSEPPEDVEEVTVDEENTAEESAQMVVDEEETADDDTADGQSTADLAP